jgi:hypothetical protein
VAILRTAEIESPGRTAVTIDTPRQKIRAELPFCDLPEEFPDHRRAANHERGWKWQIGRQRREAEHVTQRNVQALLQRA